jgi:transposase
MDGTHRTLLAQRVSMVSCTPTRSRFGESASCEKEQREPRYNTPSKSAKKDALVIADMVKNGYYLFTCNTPEAFEELRVLLSNRDSVVKRLVSAKNQIHRWVDIVFPELRHVFKHITCTGALATLHLFPTPQR